MTSAKVVLYHDNSKQSKDVEARLRERHIEYHKVFVDSTEIQTPAIKVGVSVFETVPKIEFYFFAELDKGKSIAGVRSHIHQ